MPATTLIHFDLTTMLYDVEQTTMTFGSQQPDEEPTTIPVKVLVITDPDQGLQVRIPLPMEPPPGQPQVKPPAKDIAGRLTDYTPQVEVARTMPTGTNGSPNRAARRHPPQR